MDHYVAVAVEDDVEALCLEGKGALVADEEVFGVGDVFVAAERAEEGLEVGDGGGEAELLEGVECVDGAGDVVDGGVPADEDD